MTLQIAILFSFEIYDTPLFLKVDNIRTDKFLQLLLLRYVTYSFHPYSLPGSQDASC